jgi:hypothetical protein
MKVNMTLLKNRFRGIKAIDALELLCSVFEAANAFVSIDGVRMRLCDLYDDIEIYTETAANIELQFFGGPHPAKWWSGTLLTMLMDHILFAYTNNNLKSVNIALKAVFNETI